MQIRPSGTPITASQRRSYRDTPDSGFYQSYLSAYQALNSTSATAPAPNPSASAPVARAASLEAMGVLTMADLTAFAGYCQAYAQWHMPSGLPGQAKLAGRRF